MEQTFPDVGEGLTEGVLAKWLVKKGDTIKKDQMIARVSTDKSVVDIPSSVEGKVTELIGEEGDTINVGDVILRTEGSQDTPQTPVSEEQTDDTPVLDEHPDDTKTSHEPVSNRSDLDTPETQPEIPEPIEELPDASHVSPTRRMAAQVPQYESFEKPKPSGAHAHTRAPRSSSQEVHALPSVRHYAREHHIDLSTIKGTGPQGRVSLSDLSGHSTKEVEGHQMRQNTAPKVERDVLAPPSVRRYARESGVDIMSVTGSGEHGRITREDVERTRTRSQTRIANPVKSPLAGTSQPLTPIRKIIAQRMMSSHTNTAAVTHTDRADITNLVLLRNKWKQDAQEHGVHLTYLPFFIKATIATLRAYPRFNASLEDNQLVMHDEYHIGIAVDTERGLIVPVIRDADRKSILELAGELSELVQAARTGTLTTEQMSGSTFTITSVGNFGGEAFTPIINEPNAAVLGIGAIKKMPHVYRGEIAVRDVLIYSLTYDHRIVDGADAARFVSRLVLLTEEPEHLLLEGI
jgi:pyruvate dehydrogenase E2 component (dihydrolipoamide acetyltransferase)